MDKVVQQNAANAEESASAAEEMNAQAATMKGITDTLSLLVGAAVAGEGKARLSERRTQAGSRKARIALPERTDAGVKKRAGGSKNSLARRDVAAVPIRESDFQDF